MSSFLVILNMREFRWYIIDRCICFTM